MVSWNVMNLLHRFGKPLLDDYEEDVGGGEGQGVALGIKTCAKLYKLTFGSSLLVSPFTQFTFILTICVVLSYCMHVTMATQAYLSCTPIFKQYLTLSFQHNTYDTPH